MLKVQIFEDIFNKFQAVEIYASEDEDDRLLQCIINTL
jgi:hypothetical protein